MSKACGCEQRTLHRNVALPNFALPVLSNLLLKGEPGHKLYAKTQREDTGWVKTRAKGIYTKNVAYFKRNQQLHLAPAFFWN